MNGQTARSGLLHLCGLLLIAALLTPMGAAAQTTVKYIHTDALGSVVAMTNATGTVIEGRREYEAYGQQLTPAVQDGPGYTGHVQDAATELVYMQQRYYDPGIGRFLSVDPVTVTSIGRNFNRYWYANNNPYLFVDPDGREVRNICSRVGDQSCSGNYANGVEVPERSAPVRDMTIPRRGSPRGYADGRYSAEGKYRTKMVGGKLIPRPHKGTDLLGPNGSEVKPMISGKAVFAGRKDGFGNTVIVRSNSMNGISYDVLYAHLAKIHVETGDYVGRGTTVGDVGQDGWAEGVPHLHVEVSQGEWGITAPRSDPMQWLEDSPSHFIDFSKP